MNATTLVAVVGLVTTALTGLAVPLIQGRITARNTEQVKIHDLRVSAYMAAMSYVDVVEVRIRHLVTPVEVRISAKRLPGVPPTSATSAQLRLLAPWPVFQQWERAVSAYGWLSITLGNDGPNMPNGEYFLPEDDRDVQRVQKELTALMALLRKQVGTEPGAGAEGR